MALGQAKSAVSAAREALGLGRERAEEALVMHRAAGNPLGQERSSHPIELPASRTG